MLKNKNILVGITGGIAAYKILELIRMFKRQNANVKVVLTENATNFVTSLTIKTLTNNPVYIKQFEAENMSPEHISLCDWADIMVLAPASANTISKIANGVCDNLLTSLLCAFKKTVIFAPAMNTGMWENAFVQENIAKLCRQNYVMLEPEDGFLACKTSGVGRLCEIQKIYDKTVELLQDKKILTGKKIVISAGGTKENIDPVRYIGNYSSGKMGLALANVAHNMGADVTLVSTFDNNSMYETIKVNSAIEMEEELSKIQKNADCIIMAAAVSDYRVKNINNQKIKKEDNETITLELIKNPDILKKLCANKLSNQIIVGFCAESENLIDNAKNKINKKNCDYIIANDISRKDIGFSSDENEVYIVDKQLQITKIEKNSKINIARQILEYIYG